jgi:hypothetical protein
MSRLGMMNGTTLDAPRLVASRNVAAPTGACTSSVGRTSHVAREKDVILRPASPNAIAQRNSCGPKDLDSAIERKPAPPRLTRCIAVAALAIAPIGIVACSHGPQYGGLQGDAYVALASGDQVNVDARTVRLLADSMSLDSALNTVCKARQKELASPAAASADSQRAISQRAWAGRNRILAPRALPVRVDAKPNGAFAIDSVRAGKYRLFADAMVNGEHWSWLAPVEVKGGVTTRINLTNETADDDPFRCQWQKPQHA